MRRVLAVLLVLVACASAGASSRPVEEFVARHWRTPLAPQGAAPASFTPVEASLAPSACGACHPAQLADWRTSLHAKAMGPGVAGQLVEMLKSAPRDALACLNCHAPLAEQRPRGAAPPHAPNAVFDASLYEHGIVCAACHVRAHERYGPPRRDGTLASATARDRLPHRGATRTAAFLASEFCRGCHQFTKDGFALNGKLLENTYEEWKTSRFARDKVQCQDCHMPDRRHLWRGIHDAETVRKGLQIVLHPGPPPYRAWFSATLRVTSTGVGHAFPTYVTPRVILRGELLDAAGEVVPGSVREHVIAREIELDLSRELRDTRLAPGQTATLLYRQRVPSAGGRARFSVIVEPDAFYTRFFTALLEQGAGAGEAQIRTALEETRRSPFTVFVEDVPLPAR